jgi:hypothetical protein
MFHYFKLSYFTCTFFTKFIYNEYIGPYFLSNVVLRFLPVTSPRTNINSDFFMTPTKYSKITYLKISKDGAPNIAICTKRISNHFSNFNMIQNTNKERGKKWENRCHNMYINALFHNNLSRALALELFPLQSYFLPFGTRTSKHWKAIQLPQIFACQILMD